MLTHLNFAQILVLLAAALSASTTVAGPTDPPTIIGSTIRVNALASNVSAQGIQGVTTKRSFFGFGSKKSQADMPALVTIGTAELAGGARVIGSQIQIDVQADSVAARGSTVRIGGIVVQ